MRRKLRKNEREEKNRKGDKTEVEMEDSRGIAKREVSTGKKLKREGKT